MALPGNLYLFVDEKELKKLAKAVQKISDSLIYQRAK
jgi:hypothetical protein